ncbi:hypothetical protein Tco_1093056 [Tanacetum coccineum]|uniref:Uncharacterized protein n=1 Tax=Tanacetum coccineum TaxID=301880 RepID=A0ABQ5IDS6_9ASTR
MFVVIPDSGIGGHGGPSDSGPLTFFLFDGHSLGSRQDAPILRVVSAAAKPCQGDSLEFYLITGTAGGRR